MPSKTAKTNWRLKNKAKMRAYKIAHLRRNGVRPIAEVRAEQAQKRLAKSLAKQQQKERIKADLNCSSKQCAKCLRTLDKGTWFARNSDRLDGYRSQCRVCDTAHHVARRGRARGILETFNMHDCWDVYERFNNQCFECGGSESLAIDHHMHDAPLSHSNAVLLCIRCNSAKLNKHPHLFYNDNKLNALQRLGVGANT